MFWNCFKHPNSSFLAKDLIRATQAKNEKLVNNVNDSLINKKALLIKKKILKMKIQVK